MEEETWKPARIDFYARDWLTGTADLGPSEGWLYIQICALIYDKAGPIPDDALRLAKRCNMHWRVTKAARQTLINLGKIVVKDGQVTVTRCSKELHKAFTTHSQRVQGGKKSNKINGSHIVEHHPPPPPPSETEDSGSLRGNPGAASASTKDPLKEIFDRGAALLGKKGRGLLAKMCSEYGQLAVLETIIICEGKSLVEPASYFIACLKNRKDQMNGERLSPVGKLWLGAARAVEALEARDAERDRGDREPPHATLLDRR